MSLTMSPTLAALLESIIAAEALVNMRRSGHLVARLHGFQRTGQEIVRVVREAAETLGRIVASGNGEDVVWAAGAEPAKMVPFRGRSIGEEPRSWAEVPMPKKSSASRWASWIGPIPLAPWPMR